jgi:hypothetical protein
VRCEPYPYIDLGRIEESGRAVSTASRRAAENRSGRSSLRGRVVAGPGARDARGFAVALLATLGLSVRDSRAPIRRRERLKQADV